MNRLQLVRADITTLEVDVIVNAANSSLLGGGGVDGAIHRAAGRELLAFCRTLNGARPGEVKLSPGFKLKAKAIAHAVGPVWNGGNSNERSLLERCYRSALQLALDGGFTSIAFPAISTGVYRFPFDEATRIALGVIREVLTTHETLLVTLCFFSDADLARAQALA
jgi:O-acetyl-ADP-ribose deacetylase (regulator of RNase III)